jgi:hypothetical protein
VRCSHRRHFGRFSRILPGPHVLPGSDDFFQTLSETGFYSSRDVRCCHRASSSVTLQFRINPEFSAQTRPFARLHRLRTLRWLPWQGQSSRPASSHSFVAATVPVRSKSSTYRIPFGLRHGSSPLNPLHRPTHELSHRPSTFSPRRDSVGFPSQRIPRDRRAQPINGTSKLTLVFSPIFLSSPAAFFIFFRIVIYVRVASYFKKAAGEERKIGLDTKVSLPVPLIG